MIIRPVGAEVIHTDGRTDSRDEANSRFLKFCENRLRVKEAELGLKTTAEITCRIVTSICHANGLT